jgi:mannose/cellobiose epimerase-like protein (N-acyl-D-glucosamine 2-epimerase family)
MTQTLTDWRDPAVLARHIRAIMDFYEPRCIDRARGGYINQLLDDGTVFDLDTKHLVGTCRFAYNFALCALRFPEEAGRYRDGAAHGIAFLRQHHRRPDGGYAWVLEGTEVRDGTRYAYGMAFVLLAAAGAAKAGVEGAGAYLDEIWDHLEERWWEPEHRLYRDEIAAGDWGAVSPYRGQNANMHMCEAMLAAWEATGQARFLDRAETLARRICLDLAAPSGGLVWEHYRSDWSPDWDYNKDDPRHLFKPYGFLPGHFVEWTKLLLILERHRPGSWQLPAARVLFDAAIERAWDHEADGMNYSFAPDGTILDTDRYYWVFAEGFAAAALLALRTGEPTYWDWYDRLWAYADRHFVDHEHGGWFRILDRQGRKYSNEKSPASKTDYHPLAACHEVLEAMAHHERTAA